MLTPPAVLLAVVTHNSAALLEDFARALPAALEGVDSWSLAVVDSGSADDTVEVTRRLLPDATLIELGVNRGYSAGMNAALSSVSASRALFALNPDIRLGARSVARLLDALDATGAGIAVPRLLEAQGSTAPSLRRRPTVVRALAAAVLGGVRAGRIGTLGEVVTDPACYEHAGSWDWASGAALLISRACLDAVGPWDESYWLYSEEIDFAQRASRAGYNLQYVPDATAVHLGGEAHVRPDLWALSTANRVRQFASCHGRSQTLAFRAALVLNEAIRSAGGAKTHRSALAALLRRGLRVPGLPPPEVLAAASTPILHGPR
jgi:GT2 family glycosyltransferase